MFKKKPQIKPAAPLRSSDRRKIADSIIHDYQLTVSQPDEPTPEQKAEATAAHTALRNSLLPDNVQSARFTTTHGPQLKQVSGTIYIGHPANEDSRILWWQTEGALYPSVYTLWRHPDMVPLLHTPSIVIKKLQGGADLMTPGLAGGPPFPARAKKGSVVAIASTEKPSVPVAVGVCEIDVSALQQVQGQKGHAVENLHWCGDELWSFSPSERPGKPAPEELEGWVRRLEERGLVDKAEDLKLEDEADEGGVSLNGDEGQAHTSEGPKNDVTGSPGGQESCDAEEIKEMSQKDIDTAFRSAFLYGVHHRKTTQPSAPSFGLVFPLSQSLVMSNLIQPYLPIFTPLQKEQLQIKKTSWKNIKKFIKALDKEKLLKSKEKDGHETVILDIDFKDKAIAEFKPYRLPKKESASGKSDKPTNGDETGDDSIGQKLQVVTSYRPTSKLSPLFASTTKQLLTPPEVRDIITAYIDSENLVHTTNKRLVNLNPLLGNSVFDGSGNLDKEVLSKGSVPRDALIDRILHSMNTSYAILRNGASITDAGIKTKSGTPPKVTIVLETRSGNKTVTKVSGLEAYHINARPLADELRKVCAGSTSVEPLAGAAKKNEKEVLEVMVQGPQKDAVVKALEKRGVQSRWVEIVDKTKGKKR
ncbi:hypothetical protein LTR86_000618 [Recurvomyces mirabilis]|nr:hypothetical protein LTR86_000618 [Recurvomyces mirabilis]